ncbi:hypothetical protein SAMN02910406_00540 [Ruminococcus albus]|uniref:Uncharacterized protein n=1 Tax=Ruminococcus albus TaxID=1264 RepID=A0A1I1E1K5_RUMAL|nr:hypothetical protein SAMN02910406_00540 [Ruminococcus albus]
MYNNYCFETDGAWELCAVRSYLEDKGLVTEEGYSYDSKSAFWSISLLHLKGSRDWNSEGDRDSRFCIISP